MSGNLDKAALARRLGLSDRTVERRLASWRAGDGSRPPMPAPLPWSHKTLLWNAEAIERWITLCETAAGARLPAVKPVQSRSHAA